MILLVSMTKLVETMEQRAIELPHEWDPRSYQLPVWRYLQEGGKRAVMVWHRRSGKDAVCIHWTTVAAMKRPGVYWHMLPTQRQGRKVVWEGVTKDGKRIIDAWPKELIRRKREDEMMIELVNGSVWYVVGSDNYDALVGTNPVGVVFSEFSITDPKAWDYIRPILAENDGWAIFPYTPRGRNHGYELFNMARRNSSWFSEILTVDDTGAIPLQAIEEERKAGMSEEMIQQEFYCSFNAPLQGAYYANQMASALKDGRITQVPYDPAVRVETWWDLGIDDATAIWFVQRVGKAIHVIDYYENAGEALSHYAKVLDDRGYTYSDHVLPHDVKARELGTGKSREDVLRSLGIKVRVAPNLRVEDGIEAVRGILPRCWFDGVKCERGIEALSQYRKEYDERNKTFKQRPLHDWTSHACDAFRMGAVTTPRIARSGSTPQPEIRVI